MGILICDFVLVILYFFFKTAANILNSQVFAEPGATTVYSSVIYTSQNEHGYRVSTPQLIAMPYLKAHDSSYELMFLTRHPILIHIPSVCLCILQCAHWTLTYLLIIFTMRLLSFSYWFECITNVF